MGKIQSKLKYDELSDLQSVTHFDVDEIRVWYKGFSKDCPNGRVNKDDFKKMYGDIYPQGDVSVFAEMLFRCL